MGNGLEAVGAGGMGHEPVLGVHGIEHLMPASASRSPIRQEKSAALYELLLCELLLRDAQIIAEREGIRPPHATFEVRGLVAIMHGAAHTGELTVCDWYNGEVRSLLYGCQ